jgi:hypothetical protein
MVLLGDVGHVEARFSLFGDGINLDARWVHGLRRKYHGCGNCFGCTQWNSYVTRVKWKVDLFHLEIVLILKQDRCMVCAKYTIGSEIILGATDSTPM